MSCEVPESRVHEGLYKMGPAYSLNNETDIMWEIFHYGPVQGNRKATWFKYSIASRLKCFSFSNYAATMWVYPDFFVYRSGIYRRSTHGDQTAKGFHSVRIVGWGEERFGYQRTKYWVSDCWALTTQRSIFILIYVRRSPLIHGAHGGAIKATSRSCAATTSAASRATSSHPSPTSTMAKLTADKWNALDDESAENHKLIKCSTWYLRGSM